MKVFLPDIESQFETPQIEEAMEIIHDTAEFDITEPENGLFQVIATQPAYHVEIRRQEDNSVQAICHCQTYRRNKQCKHMIAGLLLWRDRRIKKRSSRSKQPQAHLLLDETLSKMKTAELKQFLKQYGRTHTAFRVEFLAHTMHLIKRPDYGSLLMEITPIDKYGQIKANRNTIKTLRGIAGILLKQAQQLLRDRALPETFQILEPTMHHLQKIMIRFPAFYVQMMTEYRMALRLFESLLSHPMAPRLQDSVIQFALEHSSREGYIMPSHMTPMLRLVEPFVLLKKARDTFFQLVLQQFKADTSQRMIWGALLVRNLRQWKSKLKDKEDQLLFQRHIPDILLQCGRQHEHEDVMYLLPLLEYEKISPSIVKECLQTGLRSARAMQDAEWIIQITADLSYLFLDQEAFETLCRHQIKRAKLVMLELEKSYAPRQLAEADDFILFGWQLLEEFQHLMDRLLAIDNLDLLMKYDTYVSLSHKEDVIRSYADHLITIRETFGGVQARQKLSNIFAHLKTLDLDQEVAAEIKNTESITTQNMTSTTRIQGFVFDLDGVIVDTAVHHFQSWKRLMLENGIVISEEDDHHTRGASRMESLEYLLDKYGVRIDASEKEEWAARKNGYYLEAIGQITPEDVLPGALEFLIASRKAGLSLSLGSASKNARGVLEKLGISDRFDAILDGNDTTASKPDPEIFIKACEALTLQPENVVVFEDAAKGVQAAIAAGCHVVGIGTTDTLPDADIVVENLAHVTPESIIEQLV